MWVEFTDVNMVSADFVGSLLSVFRAWTFNGIALFIILMNISQYIHVLHFEKVCINSIIWVNALISQIVEEPRVHCERDSFLLAYKASARPATPGTTLSYSRHCHKNVAVSWESLLLTILGSHGCISCCVICFLHVLYLFVYVENLVEIPFSL